MSILRGSLACLRERPNEASTPRQVASSDAGVWRVSTWQTRFRKRPWSTTPTGSVSYTEEQRTGSTPRSSNRFKARAR